MLVDSDNSDSSILQTSDNDDIIFNNVNITITHELELAIAQ